VFFYSVNGTVREVDLLEMRQSQLLEEVGGDERQVVVGQIEDLRVVVDHARDGGEGRVHAFHSLLKMTS